MTVNGSPIEFPVELPSGGWLEGSGPNDCTLYSAKSEPLKQVAPLGAWPALGPGPSALEFTCEPGDGAPPRARVVIFCRGETL